jgi:carbon-monoxide dehydrogenase medium subunit
LVQPEIVSPQTVQDAVAALRSPNALALAGATDLLPAMRRGEIEPRRLVNLKAIPGLAGIHRIRGGVRIGALTSVADLLDDLLLARDFPLLVEVARDFGSPQVRTVATIGGNLCNAAPSADLALPLLALDARAQIQGRGGPRDLPLSDFFRGVNKTALRRGEILTALFIPRPRLRTGLAHAKLGVRRAMDLAFVAVASAVTLAPDRRTCRAACIALGAVAPTPMRAQQAEALLEGNKITPSLIRQAASAAGAEARPVTDVRASAEYRRRATEVLSARVLRQALQRARQKASRR